MNKKEEEYLKVANDLVFQRIFGKVGNERITKSFLEKILGIKIKKISLDRNKRMIGKKLYDKIGRIDVKAEINDGTKVIIEMQYARLNCMPERLLYYWSEAYVQDLKRKEGYEDLDKTIAILISKENLRITKGIEGYHTKWSIREEEHLDTKFSDNLEIHVIELNKFKEGGEERPEDDWIRFIKAEGAEDMARIKSREKILKEAQEELHMLLSDPEKSEIYEQRIIDLRDKISYGRSERQYGLEDGEKIGLAKGKAEKQKQVILNLYKMNMKIEDIAKAVELSKEEVEKIIKENM